jgi:hypothetical protein
MVGFAFAAISSSTRAQGYTLPSANLPSDLNAFAVRRATCAYFNDKARVSAESAAEAEKIRLSLKCESLADDEKELRLKYQVYPDLLFALDHSPVKIVVRVPVSPVSASDSDQ